MTGVSGRVVSPQGCHSDVPLAWPLASPRRLVQESSGEGQSGSHDLALEATRCDVYGVLLVPRRPCSLWSGCAQHQRQEDRGAGAP